MTTIHTEYATLGTYLQKQQYSIPSTVTVPNMQTPIIPQYSGGYGLSTLTHDYDGVGYYNINNAYACSAIKTSFNLAQCPSNRALTSFENPMSNSKETFQFGPRLQKKS